MPAPVAPPAGVRPDQIIGPNQAANCWRPSASTPNAWRSDEDEDEEYEWGALDESLLTQDDVDQSGLSPLDQPDDHYSELADCYDNYDLDDRPQWQREVEGHDDPGGGTDVFGSDTIETEEATSRGADGLRVAVGHRRKTRRMRRPREGEGTLRSLHRVPAYSSRPGAACKADQPRQAPDCSGLTRGFPETLTSREIKPRAGTLGWTSRRRLRRRRRFPRSRPPHLGSRSASLTTLNLSGWTR